MRAAVTLLAATVALPALAQFGDLIKPPKIDIKIPSLAELTSGEAPLTTTFEDVKDYGWPELDRLQPKDFVTLTQTDRNDKFTYSLQPGRFALELRSFCARGYSHGPTEGMGYLSGPWKGGKSAFLQELLARYNRSTDVDQKDMQLLVWAVLSRVKPKDMKGGAQTALLKLMGDKGPELMAEGALDHLSDQVTGQVFRQADRAMRPLLEFDNKMRGLYAQANAPFEEFERLAILPAPATPPKTNVPRGRWLLHPSGYLCRFFPAGYSKTRLEVVVPRQLQIVRDELRRVTALTAPDFNLTIAYQTETPPFQIPTDPNVKAYAVAKVTVTTPAGTIESDKPGFILKGVPKPKNQSKTGLQTLLLRIHRPLPPQGLFDRWNERYEQAQELNDRIETWEEYSARMDRIRRGEQPEEDLFDTNHIQDLFESLFGSTDDRLEQIADTHGRLAENLAHATEVISGLGEETEVNPGDNLIMPANPGSQRLIGSTQTH